MTDLDDLRRRAVQFDRRGGEPTVAPGVTCKGCGGPVRAVPGYEGRTDFCSKPCKDRDLRRRQKAEREATAAEVERLRAERTDAVALLRKLADAREGYLAAAAQDVIQAELRGEVTGLRSAADLLAGDFAWDDAVAHFAPSWLWPEFGPHNPLPDRAPIPSTGDQQ